MKLPVISLSGIILGASSWEAVRQCVETERRFYAHSLPGFDGRPRLPQYTPAPADYAVDLVEQMNVRGIERAHLLVHCSGSHPALAAAVLHPERIASLVLIGYWSRTKEWESRKEILEVGAREYGRRRVPQLISPHSYDSDLRYRLEQWVVDAVTDPEACLQVARMLCEHPAKPYLQDARQPMGFFVGLEDAVTSPQAQLSIGMALGLRCHAAPGVGHCPNYECPSTLVNFARDSIWPLAENRAAV